MITYQYYYYNFETNYIFVDNTQKLISYVWYNADYAIIT